MTARYWTSDQYDHRAQRLYREGDYERALELLEEGMQLYPSSAELRVSAGFAELAREEYAWARRAFEEALVLDPDHEEALVGLGECLLCFGDRARALRSFGRVLELGFEEDAPLVLSIGQALRRHGLHEHAERYVRLAREADPGSGEAAAELAYLLQDRDRPEEAMACLEEALELDPSNHEARAAYGNLLYERARHGRALEQLRRIPPGELWDPLAVWRTIELLRGLEGHPPGSAELAPYLRRMEVLNPEPTPEERLLDEVASRVRSGGGAPPHAGQLELFGAGDPAVRSGRGQGGSGSGPRGSDGADRLTVRTLDGAVYRGSCVEILEAMRDDSPDPEQSLASFMRTFARRVEDVTGIPIPAVDAEGCVRGAARAGMLRIEP